MVGTFRAINANGDEEKLTLTRSDPGVQNFPSQANRIAAKINAVLPDAHVELFTYARQTKKELLALGYGKGVVCTVYVF
jgi:hypothetical protein